MPRHPKSTGRRSSEDMTASTRTGAKKTVPEKKGLSKKRGGYPQDEDDDNSIDSHGNIRGLIDYDYESDDGDYIEETDSSESEIQPKKGKSITTRSKTTNKKNGASAATAAATAAANSKRRNAIVPPPFKRSKKIVESEEETEEEEESEEDIIVRRRSRPTASLRRRLARRAREEEEEETEEESDDDEEEENIDEEDDEEDDEDYETEDEDVDDAPSFVIRLGGGLGGADDDVSKMIPRRHNMRKETSEVKKFVELITKPIEDNDIDNQIDQFKTLDAEKRKTLLKALEERPTATENSMSLMFKILTMKLPKDTQAMVLAKYQSLQSMDPSTGEYFKLRNWLDKLCSVPFGMYKEMPVKLEEGAERCGGFMQKAMKHLDEAVYSQNDSKLQILQFIASKIANPSANGLSLLLIGPPGIGKTSLIKNGIAKALDWPGLYGKN